MPARTSPPDQPSGSSPRRRSRKPGGDDGDQPQAADPLRAQPVDVDGMPAQQSPEEPGEEEIAAQLNFREAQTALELSLAELQSQDLDVEAMAGLYRRASRYADRCEQLLQQVEQEVMQWDPDQPQELPQRYQP